MSLEQNRPGDWLCGFQNPTDESQAAKNQTHLSTICWAVIMSRTAGEWIGNMVPASHTVLLKGHVQHGTQALRRSQGFQAGEKLSNCCCGGRYHGGQLSEHSAESHTEPGGKGTGWGGEGSSYHPYSIYRCSVLLVSQETSLGPCPPFSSMLRTLGADF